MIGIDLVASPEPSYYEREYNSEDPRIGYISCRDVVEWKETELYEDESLEGYIPLYDMDRSSYGPPDKTRSSHHESDIGEWISELDEIR